jgi:SAM-dependent methyltransferase
MPTCPACANTSSASWRDLGPFTILRCGVCGHRWVYPLPSQETLDGLYSRGHHAHAAADTDNVRERRQVMCRIRKLAPQARTLLDVGCGFGHFMDVARESGFSCVGLEPDEERASSVEARGHEVIRGFFSPSLLGGRRFDVVILWHVVEHLAEPGAMLSDIRSAMNPGGLLCLACPNHGGLRARITGLHFEHYSPPEHLGYFAASSLKKLVARAGFEVAGLHEFTHPLHVKALLAHLLYLRILRTPRYLPPAQRDGVMRDRFVNRPGRPLRKVVYAAAMLFCRFAAPLFRMFGGDHLHMYLVPRQGNGKEMIP